MQENVFEFNDYSTYLHQVLRARSDGKRPTSLSVWARRLGYQSPRSVAMVLNKNRIPTSNMVLRLSDALGHSDAEHRYFELLVQLDRARKTGRGEVEVLKRLKELRPSPDQAELREEKFRYIAQWFHLVIKQLVATPGFREDPAWVCARLRDKVTAEDFYHALSTLLRLNLLERDSRTRRLRNAAGVRTSQDVPSVAIRQHHKQMIARALEAIEEQGVEEREITSKTLRMDPRKLEAAKKEIRRFKEMFEKKFERSDSNAVFQLNLQFFSHTRN